MTGERGLPKGKAKLITVDVVTDGLIVFTRDEGLGPEERNRLVAHQASNVFPSYFFKNIPLPLRFPNARILCNRCGPLLHWVLFLQLFTHFYFQIQRFFPCFSLPWCYSVICFKSASKR